MTIYNYQVTMTIRTVNSSPEIRGARARLPAASTLPMRKFHTGFSTKTWAPCRSMDLGHQLLSVDLALMITILNHRISRYYRYHYIKSISITNHA